MQRIVTILVGLGTSGLAALFGSYLIYEKVLLSIQTGGTTERVGLIERAVDPFWFWVSVSMYGLFGAVIALFGFSFLGWIIWSAISSGFSDSR